jgi:murein L,D-transpeptidase YafK
MIATLQNTIHMKYLLFITFVCCNVFALAQPENRRANYYETHVEITKPIDSIVVHKAKREMLVFNQGKKLKKFIISLGMEPIGKKEMEGDLKTPEGLYIINSRDTISSYHTNLGISYPNSIDSLNAAIKGISAGGDIKIHGFPNNHRKYQEKEFLNTDWTVGCIAVSDFEVDELYKYVIENCPIYILP